MRLPNFKRLTEPRIKKFVLYQITFLAIFAIAGLVSGNAMVNRHQTCLMCHEMNEAVTTWQASSHEKILCTSCHHSETGYYGFILGVPHKITDGITHISGNYESPIRAKSSIENRVCQRCHVEWRNVSPSGDLIVPHERHFKKAKLTCTRCHGNVVHAKHAEGKLMRRPPMELCLSCHGGGSKEYPTLQCKDCHTEKAVPANHRTKDWFPTHGKRAKDPKNPDEKCNKCHGWTPDFCNQCHAGKLPSTHVGGTQWRTIHSQRARVDKSSCLVCHNKENFCYRCHDPFTD